MSVPKRRLGRGLDTLLGEPDSPSGLAALPLTSIRPNPQQPRLTFDPAALAELEHSIRELGVLVPIIVRPLGQSGGEPMYELIAGERRWRAASAARLDTIPALIRTADDRSSLELAVVENLQRQDLDPLEEAMGYQHLLEQYEYTQEALAERLGKSRPAVANALRLLGLSDALKARLRNGELSVGHARALLGFESDQREALAERIVRDGLSVRDIERIAAERPLKPRAARTAPSRSADLEAVETRLRYALAAHVSLVSTRKGGRIEIRYTDDSDLMRIIDTILVTE
jgi:ParB family chromosome partitioning protein